MIKYAIPGMYELRDVNIKFINIKKEHPEYFYDNVEIEYCYGNPQFCIWDGGRTFEEYFQANTNELIDLISIYNNKLDIPIRYVFTNCNLKEKHYTDRFGNILMTLGENYHNEVVVADDNFMKYLKQKYPSYTFVSSTTKCILNKEKVKEELHKEDYRLVCLDYNLNKDFNFLKTFTDIEKEKTEFLINPICPPACANRKDHYYLNSVSHLNFGREYRLEYCSIFENTFHPEVKKNHITYKNIIEKYEPMGFTNFKIEGRTWDSLSLILTYCNYMVKPEYWDLVTFMTLGGL